MAKAVETKKTKKPMKKVAPKTSVKKPMVKKPVAKVKVSAGPAEIKAPAKKSLLKRILGVFGL
jgi:hypothetical protein